MAASETLCEVVDVMFVLCCYFCLCRLSGRVMTLESVDFFVGL